MAQNTYNFTVHHGETHRQILAFRDAANVRLSLRGYAARMIIRNRVLPYGATLLELTTGDGSIQLERDTVVDIEQASAGTLSFRLTPEQIDALLWWVAGTKQAVYTLHLRAPSGDTIPVLGGTITIAV
jgi:hypothetical protein